MTDGSALTRGRVCSAWQQDPSDILNYDARGGPLVTWGIAAVLADGLFCTLDAEFL